MKERKKIKYVEKQPPDKSAQGANQTADRTLPREQERRNIGMNKVEERERKPQAYLISEGEVHGPRKQGRDTHAGRDQQKPRYIQKNEGNRERNYRTRAEQPPELLQHQQSSHNDLSCIICSEEIRRKDWIWTCECCCISMHLKCIKTWINNINQQLDKKSQFIFNWKCPQCQFEYNQPMPKYYCFCGKHLNPEYQRDLQPHSCGARCNKKRGAFCPHPCPDFCHAGKCKPCDFEGSLVTCQCGKSQRNVKCSEERQSFQCGKKCEKILNCHNHKCQRNCHSGECMPCKKKHMVGCFCGNSEDIIDCSLPSYSCGEICNQVLDCGFHKCEQKCHPGKCSPCVKTPDKQKTCPCGKYEIQMLTGDPQYRKSCEDNIPVCGMPCSKKLECGHVCPKSCHEGPCANCKISVDQACSCGLETRKIQCWRKNKEPFKCESVCKKKRSCGQHLCNEVCCRFRTSPFTENHPCELTCNKKLNCQRHQCGQACHIGLCKKCPVIYSQPQPCPCGATFLRPPIICGTLAPECNGVCGKQMACGHKCQNTCHYGPCRCYESVEVSCRCAREKIKTTCGRQALCMNKCQKLLECGHKCDLQCHLGTCEQAHKTAPCRKICNKERSDCRHFCPQLCHPEQLCESFSCQAQTLIKCECGHRQTMSLCGALGNHKTHKSIICNKKCQNLKRFDFFYKGKQMYYPGNMVQFAFKNYVFLQNLQARLEQFVLHSQQHFIQIEFKFTDNLSKLLLTNLFQNHYHLNTHFYKYRKYAAFTLMQSEYTMIPKPTLTSYCKMITQGTIKHGNLPFQFTISFQCQQKDKTELIIKSLKAYLHKYYGERNSKIFSLHFWSQADGEDALKFLQNQNQTMEFKCSINMAKNDEEVDESEIYQQEVKQEEKIEGDSTHQLIQKPDVSPENISSNELQKKAKKSPPKIETIDPSSSVQVPKKVQQKKAQTGPKLIIRKGIPNFKKNDYPQSKQNIQDIYLIDQDELYNEKIDWQQFVQTIISKKFGPEAIEWRIRCLLMVSSFHPIDNHIFYEQFSKLVNFYNKDKESAMRILQIQRIDSKSVKKQMSQSGIYLSDHEPEMLSYLQLFNYHSTEKISLQLPDIIRNTREVEKCRQILIAIEKKDAQSFYHHFNSSDYILSCALIPFIHELRESILEEITKGQRVSSTNLSKHLLFDSDAQFIQFALQNGLKIDMRQSKATKSTIYYLKQGVLKTQGVKNNDFLKKVHEKRDKKYFLTQPEELVNEQYFTRSFFAFGDFKESLSPKYMLALVKLLKERE